MAARANPFFDIASPAGPALAESATAPRSAISKLAQMHAEAVETARLANLLGRSLYGAVALPVMAVLAVILGGGAGVPSTIAWGILITVASLAIARAYGNAIGQPFERAVLHAFAEDLGACLLYAGFAWGAGAFLAIAAGESAGVMLIFSATPAIVLALLLRERQPVLFFLAPVAALASLACVLRPFANGALNAALVLIVCAAIAGAILAAARYGERRRELPHGLIAS